MAHEIVQLCYERNQIISCLNRDLASYKEQKCASMRFLGHYGDVSWQRGTVLK